MRTQRSAGGTKESSPSSWVWLARLAVLAVALTGCFTAMLILYDRWQSARLGGSIVVEAGDPDLNPAERFYLQAYLAANAEELERPLGDGGEEVTFVISPGEHANQIASNLVEAGLLADTELFRNYIRYYGLDSRLEAGTFNLTPAWTIPELAMALTSAYAQEAIVTLIEGWRLEEMAASLAETQPAAIDAQEFLSIAQRPSPSLLARHDFLRTLSPGASLEGFLFPDTYRVPADADAAYLVDRMLENFGQQMTPAMRQQIGAQGLSVHEAVTLASIIEREAVVNEERPLIARVFLNRLNQGMRLEADPTVQYALGYQADTNRWWKSPLTQADLQVDSPYNTYLYPALPPGPIANPGLATLEAVAQPEEAPYLFFVTDCSGAAPGSHVFSETFEEHLDNVARCR